MGTPRRIKKTVGYPTSDDKSFDTYKEAVTHQADVDLDESCEGGNVNSDDLRAYLKNNVEVVQEYIKQHLTTPKKPAEKKTGDKKAAAKKTATSEAAK